MEIPKYNDFGAKIIKFTNQRGEPAKAIPKSFKAGRDYTVQSNDVEKNLFSDLIKQEASSYVVSGLPRVVSELDLSAFLFASQQILYNQSYIAGNTINNSGISQTLAKKITEATGIEQYSGEIVATLNEICKLAYGTKEPSTQQKKAMKALIDLLHTTPVEITYSNGRKVKAYMCVKMYEDYRPEDNALAYNLHLNPILCQSNKGWAELPQNIMFRLSEATKRRTPAHIKLLRQLSMQDKRKPFAIAIDDLLKRLGMWEAYKEQKKRTLNQLNKVFGDMVKIGIITDTPKQGTAANGVQTFIFTLNPNFV